MIKTDLRMLLQNPLWISPKATKARNQNGQYCKNKAPGHLVQSNVMKFAWAITKA